MEALRRWPLGTVPVLLAAAVIVSVLISDEHHRVAVASLSALSLLVLLLASFAPIVVTVCAFGLLGFGMAIEPHSTAVQFVAMLATFVIAGVINRGRGLIVAGVCGVSLLGYATFRPSTGTGWPDFLLSACIALGFMLAGSLLSRRTRELEDTRVSARLAVAEQHARTRDALAEERARIARELHDVVSHGLSVVIVQTQAASGALKDVHDDSPGAVAVGRHLNAVETTAREALGEMRRMLGLLQLGSEGSRSPDPPSPGFTDLEGLFERARGAGVGVVARLPEDLAAIQLGTGVELTVFRIIQESLTNVIKHAPGTPATVQLRIDRDQVDVVVRNASAGVASSTGGHGLVGMRERATTYGGQCSAGRVDGEFVVHATLPIDRARMTR